MADARSRRGLLDTSAVIDLGLADPSTLPVEAAVSALTVAELEAGVAAAHEAREQAARAARLDRIRRRLLALPFDDAAARAYRTVQATTARAGRAPRGARAVDLLIAATALANDLPLHTRNVQDVDHLRDVLRIVAVELDG